MHPKFDEPRIKRIGAAVLCLLVGFAVGNGHATKEAVDGSAAWWKQQEKAAVSATQRTAWARCMRDYEGQ
jgi:hypothetical protein